jgi:transcriptional regulator with XRE-family HTH domain
MGEQTTRAPEIDSAVKALKIGAKVRELRKKNKFTLQDLASQTGLSKPFLSQIENGRVTPPIPTLLKLSRGLRVGLAFFFQDHEGPEKVTITRNCDRVRVERRPHHEKGEVAYVYESLETQKANKHMEPFLVEFGTCPREEMVFMSHGGEEFLYVLQGRLEFRTMERVDVLEVGDSIYYDADVSHGFRSLGEAPAKAIAVIWNQE